MNVRTKTPDTMRPALRSSRPDEPWTTKKTDRVYQVQGWGRPYFHVGDSGHVVVTPDPDDGTEIDLHELTADLKDRGLDMPLLIRFPDIVRNRIARLNGAFAQAIAEYDYKGVYQGVFPVKVNQQHHLIEDIVEFGEEFDYGLEAGSKPELLIALSAMTAMSVE